DFGRALAGPPGFLLADLDPDLARRRLRQLWKADLEHAVAVGRPDLVHLHGDRHLDVALERARPALDPVVVLLARLGGDPALPAEAQDVAGHGEVDVRLADPGELDRHDEVIPRLVDVDRRGPGALGGRRPRPDPEVRIERLVDLR